MVMDSASLVTTKDRDHLVLHERLVGEASKLAGSGYTDTFHRVSKSHGAVSTE